MHKIKISATLFYILIVILNLVIQGISYAIFRYVHNETFAIAFEVFVGVAGNGLLVYLNSEEGTAAIFIKSIFKKMSVLDKPFFILAITLVNAIIQLVSSILPVYVRNQIEVTAISLFLSLVGTAVITYLMSEEQSAPAINIK